MFGTNYETGTFKEYYIDVSKRSKDKQIDILLVVNMFLTGFDSKMLNTLYVDKNLQYHGLLQAYSRTNRILNEKKKHGNILCFRNLKDETDESIRLYSDENAPENVLMKSYWEYVNDFNNQIKYVKDSVLTLEEAIKLMEKDCISEMEDKCKIVMELEKEGKNHQDKIKEGIAKGLLLGPNGIKYSEISSLVGEIGQNAKSISELLTNLNGEKLSKDLVKDFVKLIETDESITREIYLTLKRIGDINDEKINRFYKKILKKKAEVEYLSDSLLNKYKKDDLSQSFKEIIAILKKISEDGEKVALIINN